MAHNIEQNYDLEKILATLASLQKPEETSFQAHSHATQPNQVYQDYYGVAQAYPPQQSLPHNQSADPRLINRPVPQTFSKPPRPQGRSSTPPIDPATITDWKQGLRCVSKIATQNPDFAASIRKLMKDQEENVRQWDAGRTRLIDDQKLKRENEQTHRSALSLPGLLEGKPLLCTPEREQAELSQYDAKVYRACKAMTDSQTSSLKVLGVPFFGTRPHLILHESEDLPSAASTEHQSSANGQNITKSQHLELQRKMLNHLLEMYGD
ncbi:hypothetical protein GQ44DRAFT_697577 [Phaeosphaeriaceae sp. PMI808]|nr:hypothetical protein GQ44DRAFT_697577 [Phaeosphaeriaceae sp. PMI808]